MLNVVAMIGRLVSDPEMRQTQSGKSVASFRIACDRGRKDANGQNMTDFFSVTAWQKTAEFVCRYFQKGNLIAVDGRLQSRQYQDKSGNNRTAIEIVASNAYFCEGRKDTDGGEKQAAQGKFGLDKENPRPIDDFVQVDDDGDLPF